MGRKTTVSRDYDKVQKQSDDPIHVDIVLIWYCEDGTIFPSETPVNFIGINVVVVHKTVFLTLHRVLFL
jgi:hypothetical protein